MADGLWGLVDGMNDAGLAAWFGGTLANVSADAVTDQTTGVPYYRAEVTISPEELARLGDAALVPGMPVEVFIQTGERSPMAYLLKPLTDYFARALRET